MLDTDRKEFFMALAQKQIQTELYTEEDYYNTPEDVHVELIKGVFYDQATPRRIHQAIVTELLAAIHAYIKSTGGLCHVYLAPFAVKLFNDEKTIVEPDLSIICDRDKLTDKGCSGAPDWIIEIVSPSNPEHDYIRKLNLYKDACVREYWIVDPREERILVYYLEEGKFELETYTFKDKIKVNIYEDFWIDFQELDI